MTQKNRYTKNRRTKNRRPKKLSLRKRKQTKKYRKKRSGGGDGQTPQKVLNNTDTINKKTQEILKTMNNFQKSREDVKLKTDALSLLDELLNMIEKLPDGPAKKEFKKLYQQIESLKNQSGGQFGRANRFPSSSQGSSTNPKSASRQSTQDGKIQLKHTIDNIATILQIPKDEINALMNKLEGHKNELEEIIRNHLQNPEEMQKKLNKLLDELDTENQSGGSRIPDISTKSHIRMFTMGSFLIMVPFAATCIPPFTPICIGMLAAGGFLMVNSGYSLLYRAHEHVAR